MALKITNPDGSSTEFESEGNKKAREEAEREILLKQGALSEVKAPPELMATLGMETSAPVPVHEFDKEEDDLEEEAPTLQASPITDSEKLAKLEKELTELKALLSAKPLNSVTGLDVNRIIADALKIAIPAAAVGINQANQKATSNLQEKAIAIAMKRVKRCAVCNLPESACGGPFPVDKDGKQYWKEDENGAPIYEPGLNHIKAYPGPIDDDLFEWFQGVMVGGIRFLPDYYGHLMWIPKKSDIMTTIRAWERNEKELRKRRQGTGRGMKSAFGSGVNTGYQGAIGWR